jgi:hypothetical protein
MDPTPNSYDQGQPITLVSWFLAGATVGQMTAGQTTLLVRDPSGLSASGAPILVRGAGAVDGDLSTTVVGAISGQQLTLAAAASTSVQRALVGTPTDPTSVVCTVRLPDRTKVTVSAAKAVTGKWLATYVPATDGDFFYRFTGSGALVADGWRQFVVRPERVP